MKAYSSTLPYRRKFSIQYNPWFYFLVFMTANTLIAYGSFGLEANLWMGLVGVFFPLVLGLSTFTTGGGKEIAVYKLELLKPLPRWGWFVVCSVAVLPRVLQLTFIEHWPSMDEASVAYYSVELSQKWFWKFFFGSAQHPPFFSWLLALFFKIVAPSVFSIHFFPMVLSLIASLLTYPCARTFFPRSISLFFFGGVASGFWSLYTGQFCMSLVLLLLWEIIALGLLGSFLKADSTLLQRKRCLLLGLSLGSGFFVDIAWPVIAFVVLLASYRILFEKKENLFFFLPPLILFFLGFIFISLYGGYGQRLHALWLFHSGLDWQEQFRDTTSNITSLFWGTSSISYGPTWGGMLNPIYSSLFFMGLLECRRLGKTPIAHWLLASLVLLAIPGLVTKNFDIFRLLQLFPLLLIISGFGLQGLIWFLQPDKRLFTAVFLFLFSYALDLWHLKVQRPIHSQEAYSFSKADQILEQENAQRGPGIVLLDLRPNIWDKTLAIATYRFNSACNPSIPLKNVQWAAVLENESYKPFLAKDPGGFTWYDLGQDALWKEGKLILGIVPLDKRNMRRIQDWLGADRYYQDIIAELMNNEPFESPDYFRDRLYQARDWTKNDPFLESCFYERLLFSETLINSPTNNFLMERVLRSTYPLSIFRSNRVSPSRP